MSLNGFPILTATPTKADVGLGLVDNTPDLGKPVSLAQAAAIAAVTKASLGLANVDNTADLAKPVSTATQAAIAAAVAGLGSGTGSATLGLQFTSDAAATADADPGTGKLRWNAAPGAATAIYVSITDKNAAAVAALLANVGQGQSLRLDQADDSARWVVYGVRGVVAASGYFKFAVVVIAAGAAILTGKTVRFGAGPVGAGYMGSLTGDITAVAYSATGVASVTIAGIPWTQSYNSNGTINTEVAYSASAAPLLRTYTYNSSGSQTGVTGVIEVSGRLQMTNAQRLAMPIGAECTGLQIYATDFEGGTPMYWDGASWKSSKSGGFLAWVYARGTPITSTLDATGATNPTTNTLFTVAVPAAKCGPNSFIEMELVLSYSGTGNDYLNLQLAQGAAVTEQIIGQGVNNGGIRVLRRTIYNIGAANQQLIVDSNVDDDAGATNQTKRTTGAIDTSLTFNIKLSHNNATGTLTLYAHKIKVYNPDAA